MIHEVYELLGHSDKDDPLAWVALEPSSHDLRTPQIWTVTGVYVHPRYRSRGYGLGRALMRLVLHDADEADAELWVVPTPEPGRAEDLGRFYADLGFRDRGAYWIRPARSSAVLEGA